MPTTNAGIAELADQYAQIAEVVYALEAGCPFAPPSEAPWLAHWLELSEWARRRELRRLEQDLLAQLEDRRATVVEAERRSKEAVQHFSAAEAYLQDYVARGETAQSNEVSYRLARLRAVRHAAVTSSESLVEATRVYVAAQGLVTLAQGRAAMTRRHYSVLRQARTRAVARGFLLALLTLAALATLLHFGLAQP